MIELSPPTIWMPGTGYSVFGMGFLIPGLRETPKEEWLRSLLESYFLANKQAKPSKKTLIQICCLEQLFVFRGFFSVHTTMQEMFVWNYVCYI